MTNCCPFDETPMLRFVRKQLTPFPSGYASTQSFPSSYNTFDSGYMVPQLNYMTNQVGWNSGYYGTNNGVAEQVTDKNMYSSVEGDLLFPYCSCLLKKMHEEGLEPSSANTLRP